MDNYTGNEIFLSFYGDDFTGSTDAMESLTLNGLPAALFLRPPDLSEVINFKLKNKAYSENGKLKAFGVAGVSRGMSPAQMEKELPEIFQKISQVPATFFHYKICSTFDSSPETGNIGKAVGFALKYFPSSYIPLLVGAPALNRFCVFGNLFARVDGTTYRLDRHPTMSRHPVTPMDESDLRLHLGKQTDRKINLLDVLALDEPYEKSLAVIQEIYSAPNPEFLLIDVLHHGHLKAAGRLLMGAASEKPQLLVGSSAIENALTSCLQDNQKLAAPVETPVAGKAKKMIIMAGSCSPVTQKQINRAIKVGFEGIRINAELLVDPGQQAVEVERLCHYATHVLNDKNVVMYTALGPDDPSIDITRRQLKMMFPEDGFSNEYLAKLQGVILKRVLEEHPDARVVVAGGDTSGHVSLALEIWALEVLKPIAPGAPLCLAHSRNPLFDGLQIALKGGQNGNERYFESILYGEKLE